MHLSLWSLSLLTIILKSLTIILKSTMLAKSLSRPGRWTLETLAQTQSNSPPVSFRLLLALLVAPAVEGRDVLARVDVEHLGEAVHAARGKDGAAVRPGSRFNRSSFM